MRILVYCLNYYPELTGTGKYTAEMCEWLAGNGHEIRVVTAFPYYPDWRVHDAYRYGFYKIDAHHGIQIFRSWLYVPKKPTTFTRLVNLSTFALFSIPQLLRQYHWRPKIIIGIEPTLFCAPITLFAARIFGANTLLHIQDFELDAMLGLGMGKAGIYARIARNIEHRLLRRFDLVSTISQSMIEHTYSKGVQRSDAVLLPNWVDINFVRPGANSDVLRNRWGIAPDIKVVLYSGNMGEKQGLEMVLEAAAALQNDEKILFLLVGTGVGQEKLVKKVRKRGLASVRFKPLLPYENLPALMALADVHLVVQRRGAADLVLPSKLSTILSAGGNALITADSNTELGRLCKRFPGIARCVEPESPFKFTKALRDMLDKVDTTKRATNQIARRYAEKNLDKEKILGNFAKELQKLVES